MARQALSQPTEPRGRHPTGTATPPGTPDPTANQLLLLLQQGFWLCTLCLSSLVIWAGVSNYGTQWSQRFLTQSYLCTAIPVTLPNQVF